MKQQNLWAEEKLPCAPSWLKVPLPALFWTLLCSHMLVPARDGTKGEYGCGGHPVPRELVAGLVAVLTAWCCGGCVLPASASALLCHHSEGSVALCRVNGLCKAFTAPALRHPGEKSMHGLISFMRIMGPV